MKEIAGINKELRDLELRHHIKSTNEELNFGLVEFVNEWARGKVKTKFFHTYVYRIINYLHIYCSHLPTLWI